MASFVCAAAEMKKIKSDGTIPRGQVFIANEKMNPIARPEETPTD